MLSLLVIGCGNIGGRHLRCYQQTGRCSVAACASLDAALARGHFDAAVICTPASLHLPMALQALAETLHMFVEKPLAVTIAGLRSRERGGSAVPIAEILSEL